MIRSRAPLTSLTLRQCRDALALSQASFAAQLGVSLETYRTWDSGRRPVRAEMLTRANELALRQDPHALLPLETLARLIHVHVRTLHAAAKDGRLRITYETRTSRRMRQRLGLTQAQLAARVGAARKALVYQWESGKRCPSPLFWERIRDLGAANTDQHISRDDTGRRVAT